MPIRGGRETVMVHIVGRSARSYRRGSLCDVVRFSSRPVGITPGALTGRQGRGRGSHAASWNKSRRPGVVPMIRVAILDRHPAVRAGLDAALRAAPGLAPAGGAGGARDLLALLYRADPDVVVLDDLGFARRVKIESPRTRVVLYSAHRTPRPPPAAAVAGAHR